MFGCTMYKCTDIIRVVDNINAKIHSNDDPKDNLLSFELEKQSFLQKVNYKTLFCGGKCIRTEKFFIILQRRKIYKFWIVFVKMYNMTRVCVYYRGVGFSLPKVYLMIRKVVTNTGTKSSIQNKRKKKQFSFKISIVFVYTVGWK